MIIGIWLLSFMLSRGVQASAVQSCGEPPPPVCEPDGEGGFTCFVPDPLPCPEPSPTPIPPDEPPDPALPVH